METILSATLKQTEKNKQNKDCICPSSGDRRIILGIDPGSIYMGMAFISYNSFQTEFLDSYLLKPKRSDDFNERVQFVFEETDRLVKLHRPDIAALEKAFVQKNIATALKLGQIRGAIIAALMSNGVKVFEYSPREIKMCVTGYGNAEKIQVQNMVASILKLKKQISLDESDAMSTALCHILSNPFRGRA